MTPRRLLRDESGSTLVVAAIAMTALLSMVALAVDVGMLFTARGEAQRMADSAALAGAGSFIEAPDDADRARNIAIEFADLNTVRNTAGMVLAEDVAVDLPRQRVTVTVRRTGDRGTAIATWFARLFGVDAVDVAARATAEAVPAGAATCMKPFTIPDAWDDLNGNGVYDSGEPYDPSRTGYGSDFRNGAPSDNGIDPSGTTYEEDFGRPLVIKEGDPKDAKTNLAASWYLPWDVPQVDGSPETGASRYRWNIANCNTSIVRLGDPYLQENGRMRGPTRDGVSDLIAKDAGAHWDTNADSVVGSAYRPWKASPRVIHLPLFDPTQYIDPGKDALVFNNITAFFLDGLSGDDVVGRFLFATGVGVGTDGTGGKTVGPELKFVRLVE